MKLFILISSFLLSIRADDETSEETKLRIHLGNSTSSLLIDELVPLTTTADYNLTLIDTDSAKSVVITSQQMYQEYSQVDFKNEIFVYSFGFRMGPVSERAYQLIITTTNIYLFFLTTQSELQLGLTKKWEVNATLNKQAGKTIIANSSTVGIKVDKETMEFILQTVQVGTESEQINILQIKCQKLADTSIDCKLNVAAQAPVTPMTFKNLTEDLSEIRCESTIKILNGRYEDKNVNTTNQYYFMRYCKLSQLAIDIQRFYKNSLQLLAKSLDSQIKELGEVTSITVFGTWVEQLQAVEIVEFNENLIYFNLWRVYNTKIGNITAIQNTTQWFDWGYNLLTEFIECQQNSYSALSCYLQLYSEPDSRAKIKLESSRLLESENPIENLSFFSEIIDWQGRIVRIPAINLPSIKGSDMIASINTNFIIFKSFESSESEALDTKLIFMQRGEPSSIGDLKVPNQIIMMRPLGDNILIYTKSDIGLVFKLQNYNGTLGFSASIYAIRLPSFKISTGFANMSSRCFGYLKDCQLVWFNFTYRISLKNEGLSDIKETQKLSKLVPYYIVNNNFTGVLPKLTTEIFEIVIQKDRVLMSITDMFYGLPTSMYVQSKEYLPLKPRQNLNLSEIIFGYSNLHMNITGISTTSIFPVETSRVQPYIVQRTDGTLVLALFISWTDTNYNQNFNRIYYMVDPIETTAETELVFGSNNMFICNEVSENNQKVCLVDDTYQYGIYFLTWLSSSSRLSNFGLIELRGDGGDPFFVDWPVASSILRPLTKMSVSVFRSMFSNWDDTLIIRNSEQVDIYLVAYVYHQDFDMHPQFKLLLSFDRTNDTFAWPLGEPSSIMDVLLVDFNSLYLHVTLESGDGVLTELLLIYQCDFDLATAKCYFYTWIEIGDSIVVVNDRSFNLVVVNVNTLDLTYYHMTDFKRDFVTLVNKRLLPSKVINIREIMHDQTLQITFLSYKGSILASNYEVFTLGLAPQKDTSKKGFLMFDFSKQSVPVRFIPCNYAEELKIVFLRNPPPHHFPIAFRLLSKTDTVEIIQLNSELSLSLKSLMHTTTMEGDYFESELFSLNLATPTSLEFIQDFKGVSRFNFNIRSPSYYTAESNEIGLDLLTSGFIQNFTIYCLDNLEHEYIFTGNDSMKLTCPNKDGKNDSYQLNPYFQKDFDLYFAPPAMFNKTEELRLDEGWPFHDKSTGHTDPVVLANISKGFRISDDLDYLVLFHNGITIMKMGEYSKIVAFIHLFIDSTPVKLDGCLDLRLSTFIDGVVELELICQGNLVLSIFPFSIDTKDLDKGDDSGPMDIEVQTIQYFLINLIVEDFMTKPTKTFYIGRLLFVLDNIVVENYNNKPYLNVYQQVDISTGKMHRKDLVTVWSSLAMDEFSDYNITEFAVQRIEDDQTKVRKYLLTIIMQKKSENLTAYCFSNITVYSNATEDSFPIFKLMNPSYLSLEIIKSVSIYTSNASTYLYGFTNDEIFEWHSSSRGEPFSPLNTYKYLKACDSKKRLEVYKADPLLLVYCYNATTEEINSDLLIVFNTELNKNNNSVYPVQQISIPNVESPPNILLNCYASASGAKLLVSNARSFVTQYQVNRRAEIIWQSRDLTLSSDLSVGFVVSNVIASNSTMIQYQILIIDILQEYIDIVAQSIWIVCIVMVYLLALGCLIRLKHVNETTKIAVEEDNFVVSYKKIMNKKEQTAAQRTKFPEQQPFEPQQLAL